LEKDVDNHEGGSSPFTNHKSARCGSTGKAHEWFDMIVSFTVVIAGDAQSAFATGIHYILITYNLQVRSQTPDSIMFDDILPACAKFGFLKLRLP